MGTKGVEPQRNETQENSYIVYEIDGKQIFEKNYLNAIRAPFLNTLRSGNDWFKLIDKDSYFPTYSKFIEALLLRSKTKVKLAELRDKTILGWCMYEDKTVHYIWVKSELRRQGIGQALLPKEFDKVSHLTNRALRLWVNHYPEVKFDPF